MERHVVIGIPYQDGLFHMFPVAFAQYCFFHTLKSDVGEKRANHASYNVAKKVVEFEYQEEIPRHRLRAAYGDGFQGAPLRCQVSSEGAFPPDAGTCDGQATQALAILPQDVPCSGGSCHV